MNILILTYACSQEEGSEYEVGWKVPTTLAVRHPSHHFYVVTRGEENKNACEEQEKCPNLHFLYYAIPRWLTYPDERNSRWGEQINYAFVAVDGERTS